MGPLAAVPARTVLWNVTTPMRVVLYASMAVALAVCAYGIWRRVRVWRLGKPEVAWDRPGERLRRVLVEAGAQTKILRERLPGTMHALVSFGFVVLFLATVVVFLDSDLGLPLMRGRFYLWFESLAVDLFGLACLAGVGVAVWRRAVVRPARLRPGRRGDLLLLAILGGLLVTGFGLEGVRIAATHDPWRHWSPVGFLVSLPAHAGGDGALRDAFRGLWLVHVLLWHSLLAALPFTKLLHVVTSPLSVFFAPLGEARGVPAPTDFDADPPVLGVRSARDLSWRQLLSLDACTECGRCQDVCPAFAEGKPLSPKRVVLDLRDAIRADPATEALAGGAVAAEALWACTTCRACEEACPVRIEHVPLVLGLRQNLAMEQAAVPERVADALASLEAREHPYRGASAGRTDWYRDLPVVELAQGGGEVDVVYWAGCAAAFDERVQAVARALVRVLDHAGLRVGVLGAEERCCGDPARRTGNEYHWQLLAAQNVETLQRHGIRRLVTHCPHCLQTLRHEYRELGAELEVTHHSELVRSLLAEGRIRLAEGNGDLVAFHDPCYLGRYNGGFDAPRQVIDGLGLRRLELVRSRQRSFCCGAGGGHAFYEDAEGGKINRNRVREAAASGATTLATGCPFCLGMLEDGVRAEGAALRTRDLVELVADALAD